VDPQSSSALLLESTTLFFLPKFSRSMMMVGVIGLIKLHQCSSFFPSSSVHCRPPRPDLAPTPPTHEEHLQLCSVCEPAKSHWMKKSQNIKEMVLAKGATMLCTCREECNKYVCSRCFSLAHHNDWSRWFAISSLPPTCYPNLSFMGGAAKN
jgi:hypothetical protein